jgi:hypothetical protein
LPELARELAPLRCDAVLAVGLTATRAAREAMLGCKSSSSATSIRWPAWCKALGRQVPAIEGFCDAETC